MILWKIAKPGFWDILKEYRTVYACPPLCHAHGFLDDYMDDSYQWMIEQMRKRLPQSPHSYPLWAWYQRYSEKKKKPDLRGWDYRGYKGVRIEFEVDDSQVLLSDFSTWHCILNHCYVGENEEDDDAFYKEIEAIGYKSVGDLLYYDKPRKWWGPCDPEVREYLRARVYKSWERIFDLDWYVEKWTDPRAEKSIQATLWEINLDMVRDVTFFGSNAKK
jgi:hypothetical protein